MFLKSMDIFGFKSFAERTHIDFEKGITVIVGPNGCGKSNIVDAIKWVLGEKQAKNIRGETMEDIIFSGTDERKPLSLAEVSITLDNSDRSLDIEADSVTVGRRVFRDGESEYLINRSPVRLKDIDKLFMDTGIGKSAYSVMEQGKMDLIISTRAEDRRYIFEEAAGISRYKHQKKESLKKLQETGDNLERINDIINEIEREKDLKAKQAEKTTRYLELRKELASHEVRLHVLKHREITARHDKLADDLTRLKEKQSETAARVASIDSENQRDEEKKNDLQHQLFEQEKRLHAYTIRIEDLDQKRQRNRQQIEDHKKRREIVEKKIDERRKSLQRLSAEQEKARTSHVDMVRRIDEDRQRLKSFFESRQSKLDFIGACRDEIDERKSEIQRSEDEVKGLRRDLEEVIRKLIDAIDQRKAELQESEDARQAVRQRIHERAQDIRRSIDSARASLASALHEEAESALSGITIDTLLADIAEFESYEDGFRSILFDKTGVHAEKERLDGAIAETLRKIQEARQRIAVLEEDIDRNQRELEDVNGMITRVEKDLSRNETEKEWIEKHIESLTAQIEDLEKLIATYTEDIERATGQMAELEKEIEEWDARHIEFNERSSALVEKIKTLRAQQKELDESIRTRHDISRRDEEELAKLNERIGAVDRSMVEVIFRRNGIEDTLWTEYEVRIADTAKIQVDSQEQSSLNDTIQGIRKSIADLGPINNLAIEEYRDLKKRFEYYQEQRMDIEKARADILSVIDEINRTSVELFMTTFLQIQKNFSEIFRRLFNGGEASLVLLDEENILESGIDIIVRPPGKKLKNINLLSGGERALTAIALLFGTYMVKPSPFCFLDEIDAPLDEENIGRFVRMMKEFALSSQFMIVSHNKKTMSIAESIYGVTMEEPGISRLVSLRMEKAVALVQ